MAVAALHFLSDFRRFVEHMVYEDVHASRGPVRYYTYYWGFFIRGARRRVQAERKISLRLSGGMPQP